MKYTYAFTEKLWLAFYPPHYFSSFNSKCWLIQNLKQLVVTCLYSVFPQNETNQSQSTFQLVISRWLRMTQHHQQSKQIRASGCVAPSVVFFISNKMGCVRVALILGTLITAFVSYKVHRALFEVPPLPKIEETWWGPGKPGKEDTTIRPFKINVSEEVIIIFCGHIVSNFLYGWKVV